MPVTKSHHDGETGDDEVWLVDDWDDSDDQADSRSACRLGCFDDNGDDVDVDGNGFVDNGNDDDHEKDDEGFSPAGAAH